MCYVYERHELDVCVCVSSSADVYTDTQTNKDASTQKKSRVCAHVIETEREKDKE